MRAWAYRLRTPDGRSGIHARIMWHPGRDWEFEPPADIERGVAPGQPGAALNALDENNSALESYLIVCTPDGTTTPDLLASFDTYQGLVETHPERPITGVVPPVQFTFNLVQGLEPFVQLELDALFVAIRAVRQMG